MISYFYCDAFEYLKWFKHETQRKKTYLRLFKHQLENNKWIFFSFCSFILFGSNLPVLEPSAFIIIEITTHIGLNASYTHIGIWFWTSRIAQIEFDNNQNRIHLRWLWNSPKRKIA